MTLITSQAKPQPDAELTTHAIQVLRVQSDDDMLTPASASCAPSTGNAIDDKLTSRKIPLKAYWEGQAVVDVYTELLAGRVSPSTLPATFLESERIVPALSAEGRIFQAAMENLTKRLLPELDQTKHPITFVIADAAKQNAYIITSPNQSLICFDRKILASFENLDQLSWVLLHELTHLQYKGIFGAVPATQTEEAICDLRPLFTMEERGLNPAQAETCAMKMLADVKVPPWVSLVDAHGLPPHRVDLLEKGLAVLRQVRGTLKQETEPLPEDLCFTGEKLRGARHESFVELKLKEARYATLSDVEKAKLLRSMVADLDPKFHNRAEDLAKVFETMPVDEGDTETRKVLVEMMDSLLDNPAAFNTLHFRIRRVLDGKQPAKTRYYAPRLIEVAKAAHAFIETESKTTTQDKAQAASEFIKVIEEKIPAWQSLRWSSVDLPHFKLERAGVYKRQLRDARSSGDEVIFPWHNLAEAANKDNQIARALLCLGTWDDRIPLNAGIRDLEWMAAHLHIIQGPLDRSNYVYEGTVSTPLGIGRETSRSDLISNGGGLIIRFASPEDGQEFKWNIKEQVCLALGRARVQEPTNKIVTQSSVNTVSVSGQEGSLSFQGLSYQEFMRDPYTYLKVNEEVLCPTVYLSKESSVNVKKKEQLAQAAESTHAAHRLLEYFDGMLNVTTEPERTTHRSFIREFFLNPSTSFNFESISDKQGENYLVPVMQKYLLWVATDTHQLFTPPEKGDILSLGQYLSDSVTLGLARKAAGLGKPMTLEKLKEAIDTYITMGEGVRNTSIRVLYYNPFSSPAVSLEVHEFLRDFGGDSKLHSLLSSYGDVFQGMDRRASFNKIFIQYLEKEDSWPTDPKTLGAIYRAIQGLGIFPDEAWRAEFAKRVLESIEATTSTTDRIEALENLLFGSPLKDVDIREGAISRWVESVAGVFGDDDTSTWNAPDCPYLSKLQPVLDRVAEGGYASLRAEMLNSFGTRILAQRQVSYAIEQAIDGRINYEVTQKYGLGYGAFQTGSLLVGEEKDHRFRFIDFLTRELTEKELQAFSTFVIENGLATAKIFSPDESLFKAPTYARRRTHLECKRLHENYRRAPMAYRAAFLEELLMPAKERFNDRKAGTRTTFNEACDYVIADLLPLNDKHHQGIQYASEGRRLLKAFLADGVLDHRQQPIFLSALMAAAQRSNSDIGRLSVGQTLAIIFDSMGPAWRKFGQAIANHPSTPLDIARDMEPLKGKQSVTRQEAWALYEQTVPESIRLQNPRLGPVLESASFFTAVDAGHEVFTFLTPKALARAEDGFSIMENFVAELRKTQDSFSQIAPAVAEMVHSARTSAILETNGRVGAAQSDAMRARYNGLTVRIGEQVFPFATAAWSDHGPEFRRMQKMKGPTFNDIPATTPEESRHKRQVAKAIVYVELRNILSGNPFCVDRHGRNIRVDGTSVGHFDHGAVHAIVRDKKGNAVNPLEAEKALVKGGTIEIPGASQAEKLQLAEALYSAYRQLSDGLPLAVVIHNEIEKARISSGETPEYLIRVERALLAMNDCFKCLSVQDMKDILGSLYLNGDIDPAITNALESKIKSEKIGAFAGFFVNASKLIRGEIEKMIIERIAVTQGAHTQGAPSQWHDNPMNRQDIPSLRTTKDFQPKKTKDGPGRTRQRKWTVPTLGDSVDSGRIP